jgi:hypothetical protein
VHSLHVGLWRSRRLVEVARFDHAWGRNFTDRVESQGDKFLAEDLRRIGDRDLDVLKEGVGHAVADRRPAW